MIFDLKVGDKVRVVIINSNYVDVTFEFNTSVIDIDLTDSTVQVKVSEEAKIKGFLFDSWWVYVNSSANLIKGMGKVLSRIEDDVIEVKDKKNFSPLMNDPYGKGPEGETMGPSGLTFL